MPIPRRWHKRPGDEQGGSITRRQLSSEACFTRTRHLGVVLDRRNAVVAESSCSPLFFPEGLKRHFILALVHLTPTA